MLVTTTEVMVTVETPATIIFVRNGEEVGRISERPVGLIEEDLLALALKK